MEFERPANGLKTINIYYPARFILALSHYWNLYSVYVPLVMDFHMTTALLFSDIFSG